MQTRHHQLQQQLSSLLSAAFPPPTSANAPPASAAASTSSSVPAADALEPSSAQVSALESLHAVIVHPHNAPLIPSFSSFIAQPLGSLLLHPSFAVRRAAAVAYAALCAVLCATPASPMPEGFVSWAISHLADSDSAELAAEGLREFLKSPATEVFVPPILASCKNILEDENSSLPMLRCLLGLLTDIAQRIPLSFQPHFVDVVDLLLGWAFASDLSDADISLIMDSFVQFQWHWFNNLPFLLGLLTKFLGDMEVLLNDSGLSIAAPSLGRLHSLLACFSTVLEVAASSVSDANVLQQIVSPLESMTPQLLRCTAAINSRFGSSKWVRKSWKCLVLLAEMLAEKFAEFYEPAAAILFDSIMGVGAPDEVQALLKTNMQLLSLQNLSLRASSVCALLQSQSPLPLLRLHPNHLVVAGSAASYLFLLQHGSNEVVSQAISSLSEELELLNSMLAKRCQDPPSNIDNEQDNPKIGPIAHCSEHELLLLMTFDLKVILKSSIHDTSQLDSSTASMIRYERATRVASFISEKLNPFAFPIQDFAELQFQVFQTLRKLSVVELENSSTTASMHFNSQSHRHDSTNARNCSSSLHMSCLKRLSGPITRALSTSSVALKLEALDWIYNYGKLVLHMGKDVNLLLGKDRYACIDTQVLLSLLNSLFDRGHKIRARAASVLEVLFSARLLSPMDYPVLGQVLLDKLFDPDKMVRNVFLRLTSIVLPVIAYMFGLVEHGYSFCKSQYDGFANNQYISWRYVLTLKQSSRKLHFQQLVSVLSFISQRLRVPLSSWAPRLVFTYRGRKDLSSRSELIEHSDANDVLRGLDMDESIIDSIFSGNTLAAVWHCIHEAARYCIYLRLRTNLGGPTQTFAAIERMLLDVPTVVASEAYQGEVRSAGLSYLSLLPMRLLLEFVEALKKNIYNAYEGSFVLPSPQKQSSLFFGANRRVCEEWFSRICEPMMNATLALHCHDATIHYCGLRLLDLRALAASSLKDRSRAVTANGGYSAPRDTLEADVLRILRHASLALCKCHEADTIIGLQKWVVSSFPSLFNEENLQGKLSWMSGLVYQAQGQFEKAAAHYTHMLQSEDALSAMGSYGIQFIIARVIECYTSLSDWKCLESWLMELQTLRAANTGKHYSGSLTTAGSDLNAVHALASFDEKNFTAAWNYLDLTPKSSMQFTLDPKLALERSEQMLLRAMLKYNENNFTAVEELEKAKLMLDEVSFVLPLDGISEAAAYAAQLHCIFAFEECTKSEFRDDNNELLSSVSTLKHFLGNSIDRNQDCYLWMKVLRVYRTIQPSSWTTLFLCQELISLSRKQSNFILAKRLNKYLEDHPAFPKEVKADFFSLKRQFEGVLLKHAEGLHDDAISDLWLMVRTNILSPTNGSFDDNTALLMGKSCLKFSNWLQCGIHAPDISNALLNVCDEYTSHSNPADDSTKVPPSEQKAILQEIVGVATKAACRLCPTMGKAWISYAYWCFTVAKNSFSTYESNRQGCSYSPVLSEISTAGHHLTNDDMSYLEDAIRKICCCDDAQYLGAVDDKPLVLSDSGNECNFIVKKVVQLMETAAELPGYEACDGESPSSLLSSQLKLLFGGYNFEAEIIEVLISKLTEIWWSLRARRVSLFGHAANGFFQFLSRTSSGLHAKFYRNVSDEKNRCSVLRVLLSVLHIILNYGFELKESLDTGLSMAPLLPWQEIIPQLFARLSSHPEKSAGIMLEGILLRLGKLSPCAIVYPTLVDLNANEGNPSEELQRILDFLDKLYPKLTRDVKLAIEELGMATVLWEEQWLSTLQDLHSDAMRRVNILKEESARVASNTTLSHVEKSKINAAKYSAMMTPIIVALERRLASTSRDPRTAHEMFFQKEYGAQLKSAISALKIPPESATLLGDVWRPFDTIAASLSANQKKSCVLLSDVAPRLAELSSSAIPMPGFEKQMLASLGTSSDETQDIITISSFCEQVTVLPTKTKPKKLVLVGSDGQKYTYLLKGREDLRLDARIMQLLEAVNNMLYATHETRMRCLRVRYYSVTPISGRAGLIQWVDDVSSMYNVYKSWQKRLQLAQNMANGTGSANSTAQSMPRPNDMFYGKIIPALKEKGIKKAISRRDWPLEVKRRVLLELMNETSRQILWQELWCSSDGFKCFNMKLKRFSGSTATMSMVGHIIGLGDRHLDNILMDFSTGDVVHIDYNICFDKGKRLKIPEIVPFRLTQTIEAALGLTGVEGVFRANCEAALNALVRNKDIILMLLEVFVWDPLLEWTRGNSQDDAGIAGEERKGMELAVSLSLFASRIQEVRTPLQESEDRLVNNLSSVELALMRFLDALNQYEALSSIFYRVEKERTNFLQLETTSKSLMSEAALISEKAQSSYELHTKELAQAKAVVVEKVDELATWMQRHASILDALCDSSIPRVLAIKHLKSKEEALSLTSAFVVSAVPLTVVPEQTRAHCYDLDVELSQLLSDMQNGVVCGMEALKEYAFVLQRVLPADYKTTSPLSGWAQILQLLVNNLSSDMLNHAKRQASELILEFQGETRNIMQQRYNDLLNNMESCAACLEKLSGECSELMKTLRSENEVQSRDRLLSVLMNYAQLIHMKKTDHADSVSVRGRHEVSSPVAHDGLPSKLANMLSVVGLAISKLYNGIRVKASDLSSSTIGTFSPRTDGNVINSATSIHLFGEQIEKCALLGDFLHYAQLAIQTQVPNSTPDRLELIHASWASPFQNILHASTNIIEQMIEIVLPEIVRSFISYNKETMEAFGILTQIRASIHAAVVKLIDMELARAALAELEQNYSINVGLITEKKIALEKASSLSRDHLSWEEAEELVTQEEACRAQLEKLHHAWSQKDVRMASLAKAEADAMNSLKSCEQLFSSFLGIEQGDNSYMSRSKALLATIAEPLSVLSSLDNFLASLNPHPVNLSRAKFNPEDLSSFSLEEAVWPMEFLLKQHAFFVWKVVLIDSVLDICMHEISSAEPSISSDQLYNHLKRKLTTHLEIYMGRYLKERAASAFISQLDKEIAHLENLSVHGKGFAIDLENSESSVMGEILPLLEEYCHAHETVRAAKVAISLMQRKVNELTDTLGKMIIEVVQLEWLYGFSSSQLLKAKIISWKLFNDDFISILLNINRESIMEKLRSSINSTAGSIESMQVLEKISASAEGQLERAMAWACGSTSSGPAGSTTKSSNIPPEFHDHLIKRRKLIRAAQEEASDIMKICSSLLEFEASRDGIFRPSGDHTSKQTSEKTSISQQAYMNFLVQLSSAYNMFLRSEQEWKLAQRSMDAAANGLLSSSNQLSLVSAKAKSSLADLQESLLSLYECASEVSKLLTVFKHLSKDQTTLISECGALLDEVLTIGEGLHDVCTLGKAAAAAHCALAENLSKANMTLLPLEASLSGDLDAMAEVMSKEKESNTSISLNHGKALHQSYIVRVAEACHEITQIQPSLIHCVKELHSLLINLGRVSSQHAGNLHKALEGLGGSQLIGSSDLPLSRADLLNGDLSIDKDKLSQGSHDGRTQEIGVTPDFFSQDDIWISPPEHSYTSSSGSSSRSQVSTLDTSDIAKHVIVDGVCPDEDIKAGCSQNAGGNMILDSKAQDDSCSGLTSEDMQNQAYTSLEEVSSISGANVHDARDTQEHETKLSPKENGKILHGTTEHGCDYDSKPFPDTAERATRGKNKFAIAVLKQIEQKLNGAEIEETRNHGVLKISDQVDYLIKQATSIDNLCNMYEGWTPWI